MQLEEDVLQSDLIIDSEAESYLIETAKWAKFLSIMGFIFSGLIAVFAFFISSIYSNILKAAGANLGAVSGALTGIYLFMAVLAFIMTLYLYKFATKMQLALKNNDQDSLNIALKNLKSYYRFIGILTVIYLGIIALVIVLAIAAVLIYKH